MIPRPSSAAARPSARLSGWIRGSGFALGCARKLPRQMGHFNGRESGVESFVSALQSRAINGLLQRVAGEHAKNHRHAGIELRQLNAARGLRRYVLEMRSFAAQNASNANNGI